MVSSVGGAAFALLKADGSVVAWGDPECGGHVTRSQETGRDDLKISTDDGVTICFSWGGWLACRIF